MKEQCNHKEGLTVIENTENFIEAKCLLCDFSIKTLKISKGEFEFYKTAIKHGMCSLEEWEREENTSLRRFVEAQESFQKLNALKDLLPIGEDEKEKFNQIVKEGMK